MFHRLLKISQTQSFFLFGARGTGKSTFLRTQFGERALWIDLLRDETYSRYSRNPDLLITDLETQRPETGIVIIDEVQKVPRLLDVVHFLIERSKAKKMPLRFALTGSSARKLKRGSANLLAGRAFQYHLFPLTIEELANQFQLEFVLRWGSLPMIFSFENDEDRAEYLRSYAQTYLKEEILQEQLVRNGIAFRQFLEVAAQENGKTLNFSKLARDLNVDPKTSESYFQILEDTLVGFFLPAFDRSTRKSVKLQPKFYLFDLGIKRALAGDLTRSLQPGTPAFGEAFEHFLICEIIRRNSYLRADFQPYHYQTSAGGEIDLVLKRGREVIALEIKSAILIDQVEVRKLARVAEPLRPSRVFYVSQDRVRTSLDNVTCIHWREFLAELFPLP